MNIKAELERANKERTDKVTEFNQCKDREQVLLQDMLRLDGEIRVLTRILKDEKPDEKEQP